MALLNSVIKLGNYSDVKPDEFNKIVPGVLAIIVVLGMFVMFIIFKLTPEQENEAEITGLTTLSTFVIGYYFGGINKRPDYRDNNNG